ncbi:hypothetical protein DCCM_1021 [Desulfocucumis palustris]|uniref:Uncharacterized protein n=1 Tax=Desulfocucumis palustris TaxID=1898651 RepID=A0A2L2X9F4_9FIRM|nr:hypothetical protein DCCM_1021 [Desulfocucumis palustris]
MDAQTLFAYNGWDVLKKQLNPNKKLGTEEPNIRGESIILLW